MSSSSSRSKISALLKRHSALVEDLLRTRSILRGSFTRVNTHCGKPNCWCAQGSEAHTHCRLTWSQEGGLITRKVPPEAINQVKELTRNYRKFRSGRRKLLSVEQKIRTALDTYEDRLIRQTSRPLSFLTSAPKMSVRRTRHRQNGV